MQDDGATRKSLFIQVNWYPIQDLIPHLEHIRQYHRDPSKDDMIYDVVLEEIGNDWGSLSSNLYQILPYLPGGDKACFNNVFVGSHNIKWKGGGTVYDEGMKDAGHRWANLGVQRAIWENFDAIYPGVWHGYVDHEGVLDFMDDVWLRACYEAYLIQSRRDLDSVIGPNKALMWSPAVWSGRPLTTIEKTQISTLFTNVSTYASPGVTWLHFQDMMGRGDPRITRNDVKAWYKQIGQAYDFASLRINMELFNTTAAEVQSRENWYEKNNLRVGASFEMRYWMDTHKEL